MSVINNSEVICEVIFQICCSYQNSRSNDQNDEISNPLIFKGISEPIPKAWKSCYFGINTGLLSKEKNNCWQSYVKKAF